MPGVVSPGASYEQQQAELADRLVEQGMPPGEAVEVAEQHFAVAIGIRDGAAREYVQAEANDDARQAIDAFEPGSSEGTQLAAGPSEIGSDAGGDTEISPRRTLLAQRLQQLTEVDSTFLVERNQAFVRAQIDRYQQLEAQAAESGDAALLRNLREERQLFESTLARLDVRLVEVDYGVAALRYADRLSARSDSSGFSRQDILCPRHATPRGRHLDPGQPGRRLRAHQHGRGRRAAAAHDHGRRLDRRAGRSGRHRIGCAAAAARAQRQRSGAEQRVQLQLRRAKPRSVGAG